MHDAGFEVRHEENLREHYALTLHALGRNLDGRTGTRPSPRSGSARPGCGGSTWPRCALGFERNNIQLHQVLGVRLTGHGGSGFPLRGWR